MNPQAAELLRHFFIILICTLPCAKDKNHLQHVSLRVSLCPRQNILWERWVDAFWEERELQTLSGADNHITQLCQLWAGKAIQTQVISPRISWRAQEPWTQPELHHPLHQPSYTGAASRVDKLACTSHGCAHFMRSLKCFFLTLLSPVTFIRPGYHYPSWQ